MECHSFIGVDCLSFQFPAGPMYNLWNNWNAHHKIFRALRARPSSSSIIHVGPPARQNPASAPVNRVGIGMTPLSDWLNVLPRGRGTAGVTELPLPPKGMLWHVVLTLKSCACNICIVGRPVWSGLSPYYLTKRGSRARPTMYSTDLHKTIH